MGVWPEIRLVFNEIKIVTLGDLVSINSKNH